MNKTDEDAQAVAAALVQSRYSARLWMLHHQFWPLLRKHELIAVSEFEKCTKDLMDPEKSEFTWDVLCALYAMAEIREEMQGGTERPGA